jgi:hypothetical protein
MNGSTEKCSKKESTQMSQKSMLNFLAFVKLTELCLLISLPLKLFKGPRGSLYIVLLVLLLNVVLWLPLFCFSYNCFLKNFSSLLLLSLVLSIKFKIITMIKAPMLIPTAIQKDNSID